tara:strand:- start:11846 stop:12514 length:669 start_codon:yes stop_codon:yes gene_type:complete
MEKFYNIDEQRKWNKDSMWKDGGHEWSSNVGHDTDYIWNKYIFEHLREFRNDDILEIAPGYGRMTQYLSVLTSNLSVVDLNENCINKTKEKLGNFVENYYINDGLKLDMISSNSVDLVFSYDSFVHMHKNVIESYIEEIERVLKNGGYGFIHHSQYYSDEDLSFGNYGGRSDMNKDLFNEMVKKNGMEVIKQFDIQFDPEGLWNGIDTITIFKKNFQKKIIN